MKPQQILLGFLWALLLNGCATMSEPGERFRAGVGDIRDGRYYFAVLNLKTIVKDWPDSPYAPQAAFALGEYSFDTQDNYQALTTLSNYIYRYPKHKGLVFAKLLIYRIITGFKAESDMGEQEGALIKEIRKELFSQPLFLIFYDKKVPRSYQSLFKHTYLVYDYVDKIKVFRDGKLFLELSP